MTSLFDINYKVTDQKSIELNIDILTRLHNSSGLSFVAGKYGSSSGGFCSDKCSQSIPSKKGWDLSCSIPPNSSQPSRCVGSITYRFQNKHY